MGFDDQGDNFPDILTLQKILKFRIAARNRSGQSLAEYGLALSLITVTCLGALMLVGDNLGGMLSEIRMLVTGQSKTEAPASGSLSGADGQTASAQPSSSLTKTCYSNGWCLNLTQNQITELSSPQVAGANGADMLSSQADVLLQLAKQAEADPNMDPALKDLLTKLANSGHKTASLFDTTLENFSAFQPYYKASPDNYDNTEAGLKAWDDWVQGNIFSFSSAGEEFYNYRAATLDYLNQHSGTLPPDIDQLLSVAMNSITDQLSYVGRHDYAYQGDIANWNLVWEYEQTKSTTSPDAVIHQESNTICNNGGDTSQCIQ